MAYRQFRSNGVVFVFRMGAPGEDAAGPPPHLVRWDGRMTTVEDALDVFFDPSATTSWNEEAERFETYTDRYGLFWLWLDERRKFVIVITCFDLEGGPR